MKEPASAGMTITRRVGRSKRGNLRLAHAASIATQASHERPPEKQSLAQLAMRLAARAPYDGSFELNVPGLRIVRRSRPTRVLERATVPPALCIVAQGAKTVMLGREVYSYDAARLVAYTVDLPLAGQITHASQREPFLVLVLRLDPYKIAELALKVYPRGVPGTDSTRAVVVGPSSTAIVNAAARLVDATAEPAEAEFLAPVLIEEILVRLLLSPVGPRVAQVGQIGSGVQRVARAVEWVREHYAQPIALEHLADLVHMSVSSFHQHFKAVTSMTPLQFQKVLRLQEARRLMLSHTLDAGSAGQQVGYLSASQFSREYTRLFGNAPTRDVARLRQDGVVPHEAAQ
jgi:AraC-like DNA-binding protein